MGRKKVIIKNEPISISLPKHQRDFIKNHNTFNLSKFVQIHLEDYLNLTLEVEEIKNET